MIPNNIFLLFTYKIDPSLVNHETQHKQISKYEEVSYSSMTQPVTYDV